MPGPELRSRELPVPVRHAPEVFGNGYRRCAADIEQLNIVTILDMLQNVKEQLLFRKGTVPTLCSIEMMSAMLFALFVYSIPK